jgi:hypothetical protein
VQSNRPHIKTQCAKETVLQEQRLVGCKEPRHAIPVAQVRNATHTHTHIHTQSESARAGHGDEQNEGGGAALGRRRSTSGDQSQERGGTAKRGEANRPCFRLILAAWRSATRVPAYQSPSIPGLPPHKGGTAADARQTYLDTRLARPPCTPREARFPILHAMIATIPYLS